MANPQISRFPRKVRTDMPGSSTTRDRATARVIAAARVAFRYWNSVGIPDYGFFRGSMAGLSAPLSTPRGYQCMTRGQRGIATSFAAGTFTPYTLPVSRRTPVEA